MGLVQGCCKANMAEWKATKGKKGSQTPGIKKGESCQSKPLYRYLAKSSRSYKHPKYLEWCKKMDARNNSSK